MTMSSSEKWPNPMIRRAVAARRHYYLKKIWRNLKTAQWTGSENSRCFIVTIYSHHIRQKTQNCRGFGVSIALVLCYYMLLSLSMIYGSFYCLREVEGDGKGEEGWSHIYQAGFAELGFKLEFHKYDPRVNRHVLFTEAKMK